MIHILDAGPLIAWLNRTDAHHDWACEILERIDPPFYSCAEALAEASALSGQPIAIVEMVQSREIVVEFDISEQTDRVLALLRKYRDRRMDLADACIVRMTELTRECRVITLDASDF